MSHHTFNVIFDNTFLCLLHNCECNNYIFSSVADTKMYCITHTHISHVTV